MKFLAKRHGARSSALAADTSGATDLSCFDCNWAVSDCCWLFGYSKNFMTNVVCFDPLQMLSQETDFSLVSEIFLNASIAASRVPDQKVAKNRLLQCIKYRPRLLSVVAWVLCNKGSQLSSSLSGILNTVLRAEVPREGPDRRAALTTMLQVRILYAFTVVKCSFVSRLSLHWTDVRFSGSEQARLAGAAEPLTGHCAGRDQGAAADRLPQEVRALWQRAVRAKARAMQAQQGNFHSLSTVQVQWLMYAQLARRELST